MSLLIKALDNLDKNKQAKKKNSLVGDNIATPALSLELEAIEPSLVPEDNVAKKLEATKVLTSAMEADAENGLSLEDEAGLIAENRANKLAKTKQGLAIAKAIEKNAAYISAINIDATDARVAKNNAENVQQVKPEMLSLKTTSLNDGNLKDTMHQSNKAAGFDIAASAAKKPSSHAQNAQANAASQKVAAKAFLANNAVKTPASKSALILLAVAGLLMIWLGSQGFNYVKTLFAPKIVPASTVLKPAIPMQPEVIVTTPNEGLGPAELTLAPQDGQDIQSTNNVPPTKTMLPSEQNRGNSNGVDKTTAANLSSDQNKSDAVFESNVSGLMAESETSKKSSNKRVKNVTTELLGDDETTLQTATKRAPIKLISQAPSSGVDPTLLSAYQAFNRGEDVVAQQQYRQVLQRDVRNVDALLGMAAIAQRQGRDADAVGWYQKVLEIEPRNSIAQSAIVSPQVNADLVGTESRIKSMLALQPDGANLHAALGNLYAAQNQWTAAQESYFNASRFAPNNADYAFNLAISLDQLGKSNLALKQYQRALELLNKSGASSPDRVQLEARIQALQ